MTALEQQLDNAAPGWRGIVNTAHFADWLTRISRGPWRSRQEEFDAAVQAGNSAPVVRLLQEFAEYRSRSQSLMSRGGRVYSREQVRQAYERRRRGQYSDDEWRRVEHDIIAAGREGRISGGLALAKNPGDQF
jgi:hypothetical protein